MKLNPTNQELRQSIAQRREEMARLEAGIPAVLVGFRNPAKARAKS